MGQSGAYWHEGSFVQSRLTWDRLGPAFQGSVEGDGDVSPLGSGWILEWQSGGASPLPSTVLPLVYVASTLIPVSAVGRGDQTETECKRDLFRTSHECLRFDLVIAR